MYRMRDSRQRVAGDGSPAETSTSAHPQQDAERERIIRGPLEIMIIGALCAAVAYGVGAFLRGGRVGIAG